MCFFITVLEVYQFARDAAVAEAWLIAQEPYLMSQELGVSNGKLIFDATIVRRFLSNVINCSIRSMKWRI